MIEKGLFGDFSLSIEQFAREIMGQLIELISAPHNIGLNVNYGFSLRVNQL